MEIKIKGLSKTFPVGAHEHLEEVKAVKDLDFVVPDGALLAILGPSGCGKTTLLNLIAGLEEPTSGSVYFGVEDVTKLSPNKRGIGFVFQNNALYPHMTAYKNIEFPLEGMKLSKEERKQKVLEMARLVHIEDCLERKPSELSGGEKQRVATARALIKKPRVLLLDEPLSSLDALLRVTMREEIKKIQKEVGITTIFVTHDQEEAMSIAESILILKDGEKKQEGKPLEVFLDPDNLFVASFLGNPPANLFKARLEGKKIMLGDKTILEGKKDLGSKDVFALVRPHDFTISEKGPIEGEIEEISFLGKDRMLVIKNTDSKEGSIKVVLNEGNIEKGKKLALSIKEDCLLLFDVNSGERIRF